MQSNVNSGELAAARRALQLLAERVPTVQVAADTGIHQSQVSRLFRGQFKRISPNVRTLLEYARTPRRIARPDPEETAKAAVIRAALQTWDATPQGAQALVRLLRSVDGIRRLRR
jgi:hypothetical protein